jgi:hypothetical protein
MQTLPRRNYHNIPGWLLEPAALLSEYLIGRVPVIVEAPVVEIGVYMGKYLSVLYEATRSSVVGYDLFANGPLHYHKVHRTFRELYGSTPRLQLHKVDSKLLTAERVRADIRTEYAGTISIDGSHERDEVMGDLQLADTLLAGEGFVAYDDFINPNCLGVNEAFYRLMFGVDGRRLTLAPFAYVCNKLFLARPDQHARYFRLATEFIDGNLDAPWLKKIRDQRRLGIRTTYDLVGYGIVRINN